MNQGAGRACHRYPAFQSDGRDEAGMRRQVLFQPHI